MNTTEEEFYLNLKNKLEETSDWPAEYIFKFILPSYQPSIEKLKGIFKEDEAKITTRSSSKGKFTSVTIRLVLESSNLVIEKYKEVGHQIEGVISL